MSVGSGPRFCQSVRFSRNRLHMATSRIFKHPCLLFVYVSVVFFVMATLFPTSKICAGATVIWDGLGDGDGEHPLSGYFEWI